MGEDDNQRPREGARQDGENDRVEKAALPPWVPPQMRVFLRTGDLLTLILLLGILIIAYGYWRGTKENGLETPVPTVSSDVESGDGDMESTPEVKYVTKGEWIETSGLWSKFGVLGGAFDGTRLVMSSAESARGSLGCWISPRGRLMNGACYETGRTSGSKPPVGRTCSWQIVVLEISATTIRGAQALRTGESDPECAVDYQSRPSPFTFERPRAPQNPGDRRTSTQN